RYLDEITEDRIESDLERLDSGLGNLALLQLRDPIFPFARPLPQLVEIGVKAVPENAAFLQDHWRIVHQRRAQSFRQPRHFLERIENSPRERSLLRLLFSKLRPVDQFLQLALQFGDLLQRNLQR